MPYLVLSAVTTMLVNLLYKAKNILKGTQKASDIPIESLSQYSYIVNIEAARQARLFASVNLEDI